METKHWYLSKTIIGAILMVVALILSQFGYTLGAEDQVSLADIVVAIGGFVSAVVAIYGRVVASKKIE